MNHPAELQIQYLSPADFLGNLHSALQLYILAMDYPPNVFSYRAQPWRDDTRRPGWQAVGAFRDKELVGFAYAYTGNSELPWHHHVSRAAESCGVSGHDALSLLTNYVELSEIHVLPGLQGLGIGEKLLRHVLSFRTEAHVLLSTPEVHDEDNRAWRLYRRLGFSDVIRNMRFPGDVRPFAILGHSLPLPEDSAHSPTPYH